MDLVVAFEIELGYNDITGGNNSPRFRSERPNMNTTPATETETTAAADATPAPQKIRTLEGAKVIVLEAIGKQNAIEVVSCEIVEVNGKNAAGDKVRGKRVELVLKGDGVGSSTRRYFLRENSAFASTIEGVGLFSHAPKKDRNAGEYQMFFGLTENVVSFEPPAPPKAEKVKMSPEERAAARLAGKQRKRAERDAAAAAAAEAAAAGTVEGAEDATVEQPETVEA